MKLRIPYQEGHGQDWHQQMQRKLLHLLNFTKWNTWSDQILTNIYIKLKLFPSHQPSPPLHQWFSTLVWQWGGISVLSWLRQTLQDLLQRHQSCVLSRTALPSSSTTTPLITARHVADVFRWQMSPAQVKPAAWWTRPAACWEAPRGISAGAKALRTTQGSSTPPFAWPTSCSTSTRWKPPRATASSRSTRLEGRRRCSTTTTYGWADRCNPAGTKRRFGPGVL